MNISENLKKIKSSVPEDVTLVAVSKTKPVSDIMEAYNVGHRDFGENKIQDMVEKYEVMPKDINWHMIGHVQSNKVKYMAPFVSLIHGVDSLKLLKEINKQASNNNKIINCLLQIKIAQEDSKFGLKENDAREILNSKEFSELKHIKVIGLMGMASFTNDKNQIQKEFQFLKQTFDSYKKLATFNFEPISLSMGMSGDFQLAIECGSNMVRIGSSIFGERKYKI